jgi:hypothetical protein
MLYRGGSEALADFTQQGVSCFTLIPRHFDFDQLVAFEALIQFMDNVFGQTCSAYPDNWLDAMGQRLERSPSSECEF